MSEHALKHGSHPVFCITCRNEVSSRRIAFLATVGRGFCVDCRADIRDMVGCFSCYRLHSRAGSAQIAGDRGVCSACRADGYVRERDAPRV